MKIPELIVDLLKAYAWPIFFTVILILFKKQVANIGAFVRDIINERGMRIQHKDSVLNAIRTGESQIIPETALKPTYYGTNKVI